MTGERPPLLTARFVLVVASGLAYFVAVAMLLPVVPRYVEDRLGGGGVAVGGATGILFVGAVLLRPWAGRIGDRRGRRMLIVGGAAVVAATTAAYGLVAALWWVLAVRFLTGLGEAMFFVGAATMITDLAPVERRGEAISYWSIAIYGGLAFGPVLGEVVLGDGRYVAAWAVSAGVAALASALGLLTREVPRTGPPATGGRLLHPAAIPPGAVLGLGIIGFAGFAAFVPLYSDELGLSGSRGIFLLYGVLVLLVRIVGARLPDILGSVRAGTMATAGVAAGLGVITVWEGVPGLVVGTAIFAAGMSLLYPALMLLALTDIPDSERASVVGTFSGFFDLAQAVGGLLCGTVVALTGNRGAFAVGAVCACAGLVLLRGGVDPRTRADAPARP